MRIVKILITLSFIIGGNVAFAQDIHFTQYMKAPLIMNPASTGNFNGDLRVAGIYRNQWKAISIPFQTIMLAVDKSLYYYNKHFSVGGYFIHDQSGMVGLYAEKLLLSAAYHTFYKNNHLHVGLQAGYILKSINYDKLTMPDQWDPTYPGGGSFNTTLPNNESTLKSMIGHPIVNFGVSWNRKVRRYMPEIGLSFFNLNVPKESFIGEKTRVPIKKALITSVGIELNEKITLTPAFISVLQKKAVEEIMSLTATYTLNKVDKTAVYAGLLYRDNYRQQNDAFAVMAGIQIFKFDLGISYDINVSTLQVITNNRGAFEISLTYKELSTLLNRYMVPCDRF